MMEFKLSKANFVISLGGACTAFSYYYVVLSDHASDAASMQII
ncbi:hypothetical protein [Nitrosospira sp. Nsp1]|nr:hypothetical protein [Nitrosospira sp. Nsp1]